jgi:hypothetical protein
VEPGPRYPRRTPFAESSLPLHERIRRRRQALKLAGQELAGRAGISPAYISLIEKGVKIPSEGRSDVRVLDLEPRERPARHLVGHVVLLIRGEGPPPV